MRLFQLLRDIDGLSRIIAPAPARRIKCHTGDNQMDVIMIGVYVAGTVPHPDIRIEPHAGQKIPCDLGPALIRQLFSWRQ